MINWNDPKRTRLAILAECERQGLTLKTQKAYVLATVQHETAHTWRPVKEAYWLSEAWRKAHLRYYPYYGRGYVQLTWIFNYLKYGNLLGLDLVKNPDLALEPKTAAFILVHGFKNGTFTGHRLETHVNSDQTDFINARRCINGLDKAKVIASYAANWTSYV